MPKLIPLLALTLLLPACTGSPDSQNTDQDDILPRAREAYEAAQNRDVDFQNGPCLSNDLLGDQVWVLDIAHNPRREVDNRPENQCSAYRDGVASHFIELDPEGNLIRIQ